MVSVKAASRKQQIWYITYLGVFIHCFLSIDCYDMLCVNCYVIVCWCMIYDMIDVRMHMFDLLVKPTSKTLMFGATGPTLKCSMRFPIINFQKMKLDVSGFSSAFKAPCFLLVEGVSLSHGAFIKDMELLDFYKSSMAAHLHESWRKFLASAGWGFTWVPWFFMLSGFVLFSAYLKKPQGRETLVLGVVSCELGSWWKLLLDLT